MRDVCASAAPAPRSARPRTRTARRPGRPRSGICMSDSSVRSRSIHPIIPLIRTLCPELSYSMSGILEQTFYIFSIYAENHSNRSMYKNHLLPGAPGTNPVGAGRTSHGPGQPPTAVVPADSLKSLPDCAQGAGRGQGQVGSTTSGEHGLAARGPPHGEVTLRSISPPGRRRRRGRHGGKVPPTRTARCRGASTSSPRSGSIETWRSSQHAKVLGADERLATASPPRSIASGPDQGTRRPAPVRPGSPTPHHSRARAACRKPGGFLPCRRPPAHPRR